MTSSPNRRIRFQGITVPGRSRENRPAMEQGAGTTMASTQARSLKIRSMGLPSLRPSQILITSLRRKSEKLNSATPSLHPMRPPALEGGCIAFSQTGFFPPWTGCLGQRPLFSRFFPKKRGGAEELRQKYSKISSHRNMTPCTRRCFMINWYSLEEIFIY